MSCPRRTESTGLFEALAISRCLQLPFSELQSPLITSCLLCLVIPCKQQPAHISTPIPLCPVHQNHSFTLASTLTVSACPDPSPTAHIYPDSLHCCPIPSSDSSIPNFSSYMADANILRSCTVASQFFSFRGYISSDEVQCLFTQSVERAKRHHIC